jgi:hypothetical protein
VTLTSREEMENGVRKNKKGQHRAGWLKQLQQAQ